MPHAGESFTYLASRIRSFAFVSISCGGDEIAAFCFIIVRFQDVRVIGKRKIPCLFICIYIPHQRQRSFLFFPHRVLGVLLRLVWGQRYCRTSLFLQVWEDLRAFRKWESISLRLSGSVGIQGHAVAEAPTGVARALLYIVRGSPSFLLSFLIHHQSYKLFYHTFHHYYPQKISISIRQISLVPL